MLPPFLYVLVFIWTTSFEFIDIFSSVEQNQRALVGREALVNAGADQTSDEAINRTRRYLFIKCLLNPYYRV